jgi:hypothetical protein
MSGRLSIGIQSQFSRCHFSLELPSVLIQKQSQLRQSFCLTSELFSRIGRNLREIVDSEHTNVESANQKQSHNFEGLGIVNQTMLKREVLFDVEKDECCGNCELKMNRGR